MLPCRGRPRQFFGLPNSCAPSPWPVAISPTPARAAAIPHVTGCKFSPLFTLKIGARTKHTPGPPAEPGEKVAPRSRFQYKVGPPFMETTVIKPLYSASSNRNVEPTLTARIDRGFDLVAGRWIGYKRNYFSLVAAFELGGSSELSHLQHNLVYVDGDNGRDFVRHFALLLGCTCSCHEIDPVIVQHTAKRDRGPVGEPTVFVAVPGMLPTHCTIRDLSNIRNTAKIRDFENMLFADRSIRTAAAPNSTLASYPDTRIAKVARYERMQFSTNSSPKRFDVAGEFFIHVTLLATLRSGETVPVASISTVPLVVRGRSPSSYRENGLQKTCSSRVRAAKRKDNSSGWCSSSPPPDTAPFHTPLRPPPAPVHPVIPQLDIYSHRPPSQTPSTDYVHSEFSLPDDENTPFLQSFVHTKCALLQQKSSPSAYIDTALLQHLFASSQLVPPKHHSCMPPLLPLAASPLRRSTNLPRQLGYMPSSCMPPSGGVCVIDDDLLAFQDELNYMRTFAQVPVEYTPLHLAASFLF